MVKHMHGANCNRSCKLLAFYLYLLYLVDFQNWSDFA